MKASIVWGMCLLWPVLGLAGAPLSGLTRYELAEVQLARSGAPLVLTLATARAQIQLELWPHDLRAPGFQLLVREGGVLHSVQPRAPRTYKGHVLGQPDSEVRATWGPDGLHAVIREPAGLRSVEPLTEFGQAGGGHVLYRTEDLAPVQGLCGVQKGHRLARQVEAAPGLPRAARAPAVLEMAVETDVEFYQANGSDEQATMSDVEMVVNAVEAQYVRDVDVSIQLTAILVNRAEPDPYSSTDPRVLLESELTPQWQGSAHTGIRRDTVHLFTGKDLNGGTIGIAWLGTVCSPFGAGLSQSRYSSRLPNRADLTAHELGHNWDANHCDSLYAACCPVPSYTMCSSLKQTVRNEFGALDQTVIEAFRDQIGSCVELGLPTPTPPPTPRPTATPADLPALTGGGAGALGWLVLLTAALGLACRTRARR